MIAEIDRIRGDILPIVSRCGVGSGDDDVVVEADRDTEGFDFLRVQVKLPQEPISDEQLLSVLEAIEDAVSLIDDRTVSVRFDDPV